MPVTCGSVGDFIAISLLVKDLVAALNQSRGSQAEYKQLVGELKLLQDMLARIGNLCNTTTISGRSLEVAALNNTALQVAQTCQKCIEVFNNTRLKKYDKTLGRSGAREKSEAFKAAMAKIRWQLGEKEEVARFRAEIAGQTTLLDLVLSAITLIVGRDSQDILVKLGDAAADQLQAQHGAFSKLSDAVTETNVLVSQTNGLASKTNTLSSRTADELSNHLTTHDGALSKISDTVAETSALVSKTSVLACQTNALVTKTNSISSQIVDELADHFQAQHEALAKVSDTANETNALISRMNTLSGQIVNGLATIGDLCTQAKTTMSKILFINVATYKMVLALKTSLPGYLERSLHSEPFILEDAIGRISPVHLQFISSWEALDAVLEARFRGLQGHDKVQSGLWTLQDHSTGRDISRGRIWEGAFLPGQRVEMSILFQWETTVDIFETFDPFFQAKTSGQAACPRCQADVPDSRDAETQCDTCGLCFRRIVEIEESGPTSMPEPCSDMPSSRLEFMPQLSASKRRREADDLDFSGFKRIRIFHKEIRAYKTALERVGMLQAIYACRAFFSQKRDSKWHQEIYKAYLNHLLPGASHARWAHSVTPHNALAGHRNFTNANTPATPVPPAIAVLPTISPGYRWYARKDHRNRHKMAHGQEWEAFLV